MPTDNESLYNVLKAFVTQDPNGNGKKDYHRRGDTAESAYRLCAGGEIQDPAGSRGDNRRRT